MKPYNILIILLFLLPSFLAFTTLASPSTTTLWLRIVDFSGVPITPDNTPYIEGYRIVIWNVTGTYVLANTNGAYDPDTGRIYFTVDRSIISASSGRYNVTLLVIIDGQYYLLNWTKDIDPTGITASDLINSYVNTTVKAGHWHKIRFRAVTDPDRDGVFDTPLYDGATLKPRIALFNVYFAGLFVQFEGDSNGYAKGLFNFSDSLAHLDVCQVHIENFTDISVEIRWRLYNNTSVRVGLYHLNFTHTEGSPSTITLWGDDQIQPYTFSIGIGTGDATAELRTYTIYHRFYILDPCGNTVETGNLDVWKFDMVAPIEDTQIVIATFTPTYYGATDVTWIPDVSLVYGVNVTLALSYYNVVVFDHGDFNTTLPANITNVIWVDAHSTPYKSYVYASLFKLKVRIYDKELTPNPLTGARVYISVTPKDSIKAVTGGGGYVMLPPYNVTASGDPPTVVYESVMYPLGYLPVPYHANYSSFTFRIEWKLPGSEDFVDVTPVTNNTVLLNMTWFKANACTAKEYRIFVDVYDVVLELLDLCGLHLSTDQFPNASVIVYYKKGDNFVDIGSFPVSATSQGYTMLKLIPRGTYKVKLYWKGLILDGMIAPDNETEPIIVVNDNILSAIKIYYPIGNLQIHVTMWDKPEPLRNIRVKLYYYKHGELLYEEDLGLTDKYGYVNTTGIPVKIPEYYEFYVIGYTTSETNFIRHPIDDDIKVFEYKIEKIGKQCWNTFEAPAWIYSFYVEAVDHKGDILYEYITTAQTYPVYLVLQDDVWQTEYRAGEGFSPLIFTDFRIINRTGYCNSMCNEKSFARWIITSEQYPGGTGNNTHPHLFVAGANYTFLVWHGGVMVYNYTVMLPRPYQNITIYINETTGEVWTVSGHHYNYTWKLYWRNGASHPFYLFIGRKSWKEKNETTSPTLKLVTWTLDLNIYPLSYRREYIVDRLKLAIARKDVLNFTIVEEGSVYDILTDPSAWASLRTGYVAISDEGTPVITLSIPVWYKSETTVGGTRFGANIVSFYILASSLWATPGIPDEGVENSISIINASGIPVTHNFTGYIVSTTTDPADVRLWFKDSLAFTGNNTGWFGDNFNITLWSGASKNVTTYLADCICVTVYAPDETNTLKPLANEPVQIYLEDAVNITKKTDSDGTATFTPFVTDKVLVPIIGGTTSLDVVTGDAIWLYLFNYTVKTWIDYSYILQPYGISEDEFMDPHRKLINVTVFTPDNGLCPNCITMRWYAITFQLFDWQGKPVRNMLVALYPRFPFSSTAPIALNFSNDAGKVLLYVPPGIASEALVFFRDSLLLERIGAIPRSILIHSSTADYDTPRYYGVSYPGATPGGTIELFMYVPIVRLYYRSGTQLKPPTKFISENEVYAEITYPDTSIIRVPVKDVIFTFMMNTQTLVKMAGDDYFGVESNPSRKYNPEMPTPQNPLGAYSIRVYMVKEGREITLGETTINIEKGRFETAKFYVDMVLDIQDTVLALSTPFNTPLDNALIMVTDAQGKTIKTTTDNEGKASLREVIPPLTLSVKEWRGFKINYTATIEDINATSIVVPEISKLVIHVVGSRGQGIPGAVVTITGMGTSITGSTDDSGTFQTLCVGGKYTITVEKSGYTATTVAIAPRSKTKEYTLRLNIFLTIAGWDMSFHEFAGLLVLLVLLVVVLFILAHEYSVWRTRRKAMVIKPATIEKKEKKSLFSRKQHVF